MGDHMRTREQLIKIIDELEDAVKDPSMRGNFYFYLNGVALAIRNLLSVGDEMAVCSMQNAIFKLSVDAIESMNMYIQRVDKEN